MKEHLLALNSRGLKANWHWLPALEKIIVRKFNLKKQISLVLVSPVEIKKLNKVYRHKNKVTDVLSFNIDSREILGEVVICLDQAKKQAKDNKKKLASELQWLAVHGILHLLGFDHEISHREAIRQADTEKVILKLLNKA